MTRYSRYTVSGSFPITPGNVLLVRNGDGDVCERIVEEYEGRPYGTPPKKHWDVIETTIKEVS